MAHLITKQQQSSVSNNIKSVQKKILSIFSCFASTSFVLISTSLFWQTYSNRAEARPGYIEFTNIPECVNPATEATRNYCRQLSYRRADLELQQTYRALLDKVTGKKRQNLVYSQLNWLKYRNAECNFADSLSKQYSAGLAEKYECYNALAVQRTYDLIYYYQGKLPAWNSNNNNNYQWTNGQLNFLSANLKRALNPEQENKLEAANSAWREFVNTNCEYETLGWASNARNCKLRLTEQRITDIADYIAQPANTQPSNSVSARY